MKTCEVMTKKANNNTSKTLQVLDHNKTPLPNVAVYIVGTTKGVVTDFNGYATINASKTDTIEISHVSYTVEQFTADDLPNVLQLDGFHGLDEVTVTAQPKQAGIGWVLTIIGLGFLLYKKRKPKPMNATKPKPTNQPLKVTI